MMPDFDEGRDEGRDDARFDPRLLPLKQKGSAC